MRTALKIEIAEARAMAHAALKKAGEIGVLETVCVCDDGGFPLLLDSRRA